MTFLSWDSETHLISPGCLAPKMICISYASSSAAPGLVLARDGLPLLRNWLLDPSLILVDANLPYDFGVACAEDASFIPLVFDAYAAGRVSCVQTLQKLIDVALGMRKWRRVGGRVERASYGLDDLVKLYLGEHLEKVNTWRLRYSELDGVPIEEWPEDARTYAIGDAVQALRMREAQEREIKELWGELPNQAEQQRAAWALHLMSMYGLRADPTMVDKFEEQCREKIGEMEDALDGSNIFKVSKKTGALMRTDSGAPQRIMKEIVRRVVEGCTRVGVAVPMTRPTAKHQDGQVRTNKDTLLLTDDPELHILAESMKFAKHLGQWGPVLRAAVTRNVCARYEVLVETGRTAASGSEGQEGSNYQNPPRDSDVRPAIVPRYGWVFGFADADTIELRAHAQNCIDLLGWSRMAEALVEQAQSGGPDLHEVLAGAIMGIDPRAVQAGIIAGDAASADARQFAKIPNFGFPGGLGAPVFVAYAAAQLKRKDFLRWFDVDRDKAIKKAQVHRDKWFAAWPENRDYFKRVGAMIDTETDNGKRGVVHQLMSGRIRGDCKFTAASNGFFQGRVADAMKEVLFRLADECYTGRCTSQHAHGGSSLCTHDGRSILFGSRPSLFVHDETGVEHPEDGTESDRCERQAQINVECLSRWMPAIPCTSSGVLVRRWAKSAKQLRVNGKIVPVKPEKVKDADGQTRTRWVHDIRSNT